MNFEMSTTGGLCRSLVVCNFEIWHLLCHTDALQLACWLCTADKKLDIADKCKTCLQADRTGRSGKPPKALQAAAMHAQKEATAEDDDEDDPETLPLLAKRVMAGRQSIVPGHSKASHLVQ